MKEKKVRKVSNLLDTYLIAQAVNNNAEVLEDALSRIKELEKRLNKEQRAGKLLEIEEFSKSEDMTREEAIDLVIKVFDTLEGECNIEYDWSKEHKARDMAIKALEQESFKNAYIQVAKERDIAIEQLNELGICWGEKIEPCNNVRAEIEAQEKWLAEAGYNAYNVGVAFFAIKRALEK